MTDHRQDDDDLAVRQAYREAARMQEESATTATRDAILAAAARAVQAGPRALNANPNAGEVKTGSRSARVTNWLSFRQPLALAATLVFGVGVGLILFDQEHAPLPSAPVMSAPIESSNETAVSEPAQAKSESDQPAAATNAVPVRTVHEQPKAQRSKLATASDAEDKKQKEAAPENARAENKVALAADAVAPEPQVVARQDAPATMSLRSAPPAAAPAMPMSSTPTAAKASNRPGAETMVSGERRAAASTVTSGNVQRNAADWLAFIIELRKSGKVDEAERELRAFRQAYPEIDVPREALP